MGRIENNFEGEEMTQSEKQLVRIKNLNQYNSILEGKLEDKTKTINSQRGEIERLNKKLKEYEVLDKLKQDLSDREHGLGFEERELKRAKKAMSQEVTSLRKQIKMWKEKYFNLARHINRGEQLDHNPLELLSNSGSESSTENS